MGKRSWQMESNYHASLHTERQSILWHVCHEGIRPYFICCIIMYAYIYVKFCRVHHSKEASAEDTDQPVQHQVEHGHPIARCFRYLYSSYLQGMTLVRSF